MKATMLAVLAASLAGASALVAPAPQMVLASTGGQPSPPPAAQETAAPALVTPVALLTTPAPAPLSPAAATPVGSFLPGILALEQRAGEPQPPPGADAIPAVPLPVDPAVAAAIAGLRDRAGTVRHGLLPAPLAQQAVGRALDQVGDPYVWGATGPDSFDCSGLMWWSYDGVGIDLPRVSRDQAAGGGVPVAIEDLLPGDLVFFAAAAWDPGVVHHVGMYVGDGLMVDAPRPGEYVRVEAVSAAGYAGAVRPVAAVKPAKKHPGKGAGKHGDQPADKPRRTAVPLPTTAPATPTPGSAPATAAPGGPVSAAPPAPGTTTSAPPATESAPPPDPTPTTAPPPTDPAPTTAPPPPTDPAPTPTDTTPPPATAASTTVADPTAPAATDPTATGTGT